jgi:hypothetical protein
MPAPNRRRTIVRYVSTILALIGWTGSLWSWLDHGHAAGVHPGFMTALSVGIVFSMIAGQAWMLPDRAARHEQAAVYAVGFQEGLGCGACPLRPEPGSTDDRARHLGIVRS